MPPAARGREARCHTLARDSQSPHAHPVNPLARHYTLTLLALTGCGDFNLPGPTPPPPPPPVLTTAAPCLITHFGPDQLADRLERRYYDADGRLLARSTRDYAADTHHRESWAYDTLGRLVAYEARGTFTYGQNPLNREQHSYDAAGHRIRTLQLSANLSRTINRTFDPHGRPLHILTRDRPHHISTDDPAGQPTREETTRYDDAGRPLERTDTHLPGGPTTRYTFAYDPRGRLTERQTQHTDQPTRTERWQWTDDDRLRAATLDRDGDGRDDYREDLIDRPQGDERLIDHDADGHPDRRILTHRQGPTETLWTDHDADGTFDAVVMTTRTDTDTYTWHDHDADGHPDSTLAERHLDGYTDIRHDDDGDGHTDRRYTTWTDPDGHLIRAETRGPADALVEVTTTHRDPAGRPHRETTVDGADNPIASIERRYDCDWNPPALTDEPLTDEQ